MSVAERGKTKADYLFDSHKYAMALSEYEKLLSVLPDTEVTMRAVICYNMAAAQMQLFDLAGAVKSYKDSYDCVRDNETLKAYLAAKRLSVANEEYIAFLADHPEYYDMSLETEGDIRKWNDQFETTQQSRMLFTLKVLREDGSDTSGDPAPYYSEVGQITSKLKNSYREMVQTNAVIQKTVERTAQKQQ